MAEGTQSTLDLPGRANRLPSLYLDPDQRAGYGWDVQSHVAAYGEAKRWMPFTWAQIGMPGAGPGGIAFYGPYVVVDGPEGNLSMDATPHVECTLRMIVHRGQR